MWCMPCFPVYEPLLVQCTVCTSNLLWENVVPSEIQTNHSHVDTLDVTEGSGQRRRPSTQHLREICQEGEGVTRCNQTIYAVDSQCHMYGRGLDNVHTSIGGLIRYRIFLNSSCP